MIRYLGTLLCSCVLLMRCSNAPGDISGGTVIPNLIVGNVLYQDSRPAIGKSVTIKGIILAAESDSVVVNATVLTDETGRYEFKNIQRGKYIITADDPVEQLSSVIAKFEKRTDSTVIADNMVLHKKVNLMGRVLFDDGISRDKIEAFIPGISQRMVVDSGGYYVIPLVPQGHYEIAFVSGNTINFVPVTISDSIKTTVFIKDITIDLQASSLNAYNYYDHTFDYSYSVLPVGYKVGNEPGWYVGKDFSGAKYFAVVGNNLKEYLPEYTMLFLIGTDGSWLSDECLVTRLEKEKSFSVFVKEHDKVSLSDTMGIDIIYISSSIIGDTLKKYMVLRDVHIPVVCGEDNYFPVLMMTDSAEGTDFGDYSSDGFVKILMPDHVIASGLVNYVQVLFGDGYISWGKPSAKADVIAANPGNDKIALIFCYDKDVPMVGKTAPARRVGHFFVHTKYTIRNLTEDGWKLFTACVFWAMGEIDGSIISSGKKTD